MRIIPRFEFRVNVDSMSGWLLFVKGRYNAAAGTLNYALILKTEGRIYALDLGKDHHNPQCQQVGEKHKHSWSERYRDKRSICAYRCGSSCFGSGLGLEGSSASRQAFNTTAE